MEDYVMKICIICKQEKDRSEFYSDKRGKDGLYAKCKNCHLKKKRNQYKNNLNLREKESIEKLIAHNKKQNLIGKKFNKLTVDEFIVEKNNNGRIVTNWKCLCDCGCQILLKKHLIKSTQSCGCLKSIKGSDHQSWRGYKEISGSFFGQIKNGANKRNIDFQITIEQIYDLYLLQNKKCALSGVDLFLGNDTRRNSKTNASLDRINSSKIYTIDNVQWVHKDINKMKNNLPEDKFISWCNLVSKIKG
jgi:hypothetical protein